MNDEETPVAEKPQPKAKARKPSARQGMIEGKKQALALEIAKRTGGE